MHFKGWYLKLLLAWGALALPGFILGWAFTRRAPWNEFLLIFEGLAFDPVSAAVTLLGWVFLLSPLLLVPFGMRRQREND